MNVTFYIVGKRNTERYTDWKVVPRIGETVSVDGIEGKVVKIEWSDEFKNDQRTGDPYVFVGLKQRAKSKGKKVRA